MEIVEADSFTLASDLQFIEKRLSRLSLKWKISCMEKIAASEETIVSPFFRFSNWYWKLSLHLDYSSHRYNIYLKCVDINSTSAFTISLTSSTISDGKAKITTRFPDRMLFFGNEETPSKTILNANIHRCGISSLTISFNMCLEENIKPVFQESINEEKKTFLGSTLKLSSDFEELSQNRQFSDVTLKLGEEEFPAHKSVLSARSKVFAAMFEHDMKENLQGTVDLVQMEADTVQDMLQYIYCAKVRELSSTEALNLYVAADRYDLPELRDFCREVIMKGISANNVFDIAAVADICSDELIIQELKSFILKNGKDIVKNDQWNTMCTNNPVVLKKMFEWSFSGQ